jgi:lysophospholipase L1-like esterase
MLAAVVVAASIPGAAVAAKIKIACVGASTTSGDGSTAGHHYPDELQRLEGTAAEVRNFGVSGTTMLRAVSASYWNTPQLSQAVAYQPDVAVIWFGGNDAKPENWTAHGAEFLGDYEAMIRMFQALPSHPRTYVVLSLLTRDTEGIPKAVVDGQVIPLCRQAAAETGSGIVDVHDDLASHPEYFPDGIHPDDQGTVAVATLVYEVISASPDAGVADGSSVEVSPDAVVPGTEAGTEAPSMPSLDGATPSGAGVPPDASAANAAGGAGGAAAGRGGGPTAGAPMMKGPSGGGCDVGGSAEPSVSPVLLFSVFILGATALRQRGGSS